MDDGEPDNEPAISASGEGPPEDLGDAVALMEPLLVGESSRHRGGLTDLALELAARTAGFRRSLLAALLEREVLVSKSPRAPLRLAFPAKLASRWTPGPFPER
jgi:hypothetical protein